MTYTFKFTNRRGGKVCSFNKVVMGIISVNKDTTKDEIDKLARAYWKENGVELKDDENSWGRFYLKRKDDDIAVTLSVFCGLTKERTGWAIDSVLKVMETWNGIEPTFDDYKRINKEFEEQFID